MGLHLVELDKDFPCFVSGEMEARFIYAEIFADGNYDLAGLPENAFVVDVGANIGLFSIYVKSRCPGARVLAFEPAPGNLDALRRNLDLHGNQDVTVYPCCLGTEASAGVTLTYYPQLPGNSTLHPGEKELQRTLMAQRLGTEDAAKLFDATEVSVPVQRLSTVLADGYADVPSIDLLKIDVEGAELEVLGGVDAADWARVGRVMLEVADFDGKLGEVERLLRSHGFSVSSSPVPFMWEELRFHYVTAERRG